MRLERPSVPGTSERWGGPCGWTGSILQGGGEKDGRTTTWSDWCRKTISIWIWSTAVTIPQGRRTCTHESAIKKCFFPLFFFFFFKEASARTQKRHFLFIVARQLYSRKRFSQIWLWRIHLPQRTFLIRLEVTLTSRSAAHQIFHLGRCSFPITCCWRFNSFLFLIQSKRQKEKKKKPLLFYNPPRLSFLSPKATHNTEHREIFCMVQNGEKLLKKTTFFPNAKKYSDPD